MAVPVTSSVTAGSAGQITSAFCHTFDLTKRLVHPASSTVNFLQLDPNPSRSPFEGVLDKLATAITDSGPDKVHRVVIPSLLSPVLYPPHASSPQHVLHFMHALSNDRSRVHSFL